MSLARLALGVVLFTACTEKELASSVIVADPVDGTELERRTVAGETGFVRVAAMPPGRDDLLVWQTEDGLVLRQDREWRELSIGAHDIAFGAVSGNELPDIFGGAGTRALVWSAEDGSVLAEVESAMFPWDTVVADWDGDGDDDLILSSPTKGAAFHARDPHGLGELQPILESFGLDFHMDVGDLDRDGRLDVVQHVDGTIAVAFGGPGGTVADLFQIEIELSDVEKITLGDLTGDGNLDVVVGARDGTQVFENAADRSLTAGPSFSNLVPRMLVVDYDEDGDLDILGQPPRDELDDWGREILVVHNDEGILAEPAPLFELPEQIVDFTAGRDLDGRLWLAMSTFTFRDVPTTLEPEY